MGRKITVIGAGATGHGLAALLKSRDFDVALYDSETFSERFSDIESMGGIELRGRVRLIAKPETTCDPEKAVRGAEIIFVNVMSDRHAEIAAKIAPFLENGQHIVIIPGNLGSFIFRRVFREMGVTADVTVSEKEGNFFPCRLSGAAEVTVGLPLNLKGRIAALPASDTPKVLDALKGIVEYTANENVFEGAINTGNVIMHIGTTVLSASAIHHQGKDFSLFKYGFTPAAVTCDKAIHDERILVMEAMHMPEHHNPLEMIGKVQDPSHHPENSVFYEHMTGPDALDHRYLNEDCGCGGAFAVSAGRRCGIEMPVLSSFITIAGAINGRDYLGKDGRTLENLGFPAEMSMQEILRQI